MYLQNGSTETTNALGKGHSAQQFTFLLWMSVSFSSQFTVEWRNTDCQHTYYCFVSLLSSFIWWTLSLTSFSIWPIKAFTSSTEREPGFSSLSTKVLPVNTYENKMSHEHSLFILTQNLIIMCTDFHVFKGKGKGKFTLEQAHRGTRCIAILFV